MSNYNLISCDDHLDLGQLPADLWTARLPSALHERAPHIEERDGREVTHMTGWLAGGGTATVEITAPGSPVSNFAFDVTPAALVTALITDRGVCAATSEGLLSLFEPPAPQGSGTGGT